MSKFDDLVAKIRSLRELDKETERLTLVRKVGASAKLCEVQLSSLKCHAPYVDQVLGGSKVVTAVSSALTGASLQSEKLRKLIQRDKFGSEKAISEQIENLESIQKSAEKQIKEQWARIQSRIGSVVTIQELAEKVELSSAQTLKSAVSNYQYMTNSWPGSDEDVESIGDAWENCTNAVKNSGLEGNVKKLLEGAIAGDGDPKLLLEEDVSEFLKAHPMLWSTLKIALA